MTEDIVTEVLIIGAGPAGLAAAIYTARANRKTIILRGKSQSRLEQAHLIENYPGFLSIRGDELLQKFEQQAQHFGARIIETDAIDLGLGFDPKMVNTRDGMIITDSVILAMGKGSAKSAIENEEDYIGLGVSYCVVCDGALYRGKDVVIYGKDNDALEDALMLSQIGCRVTLIASCSEDACDPDLVEKIRAGNIASIFNAKVTRVKGEGTVSAVDYEQQGRMESVATSALFIISHVPGSSLLTRAGVELDSKNCVEVNRSLETNIPGVYAAGDMVCGGMQIATAVGDGVIAALSVVKYLRNRK